MCEEAPIKGQVWQWYPSSIVVLQNVLEQYKELYSQHAYGSRIFS